MSEQLVTPQKLESQAAKERSGKLKVIIENLLRMRLITKVAAIILLAFIFRSDSSTDKENRNLDTDLDPNQNVTSVEEGVVFTEVLQLQLVHSLYEMENQNLDLFDCLATLVRPDGSIVGSHHINHCAVTPEGGFMMLGVVNQDAPHGYMQMDGDLYALFQSSNVTHKVRVALDSFGQQVPVDTFEIDTDLGKLIIEYSPYQVTSDEDTDKRA